jgi:hypothetical protein
MSSHLYYFEKNIIKGAVLNLQGCKKNITSYER